MRNTGQEEEAGQIYRVLVDVQKGKKYRIDMPGNTYKGSYELFRAEANCPDPEQQVNVLQREAEEEGRKQCPLAERNCRQGSMGRGPEDEGRRLRWVPDKNRFRVALQKFWVQPSLAGPRLRDPACNCVGDLGLRRSWGRHL